ncbi:hypothetical protein BXZ70DRAFT_312231 [Cristinia sonorae]|uniref:Uncharacterized protein n=1 Tax=Cristinia sonorae TaxID=1940300 RepID=A0A8K0UKX3_9AGAR|nr:hypothetical protein BXZ70DRAFT_312231 [Cristinia sonorae]
MLTTTIKNQSYSIPSYAATVWHILLHLHACLAVVSSQASISISFLPSQAHNTSPHAIVRVALLRKPVTQFQRTRASSHCQLFSPARKQFLRLYPVASNLPSPSLHSRHLFIYTLRSFPLKTSLTRHHCAPARHTHTIRPSPLPNRKAFGLSRFQLTLYKTRPHQLTAS